MTALAEALEAAQAKALAALEKAYVRGTLDAEAFTERLNEIGCTDAIDQGLLIAERLAREHEIEPPDLACVTRAQASEIIDSLQRGTYDPEKWSLPF